MRMRRHVLIARLLEDVPHMWGRFDWDGAAWLNASVIRQTGERALDVQTSLRALVEDVIANAERGADLTISPRVGLELIQRGGPASIDVPEHASVELLLPLRAELPGVSATWTHALVTTESGVRLLTPASDFSGKRLGSELRSALTSADLKTRESLFDRRELWLRHDITAADLAPTAVPTPTAPNTAEAEAIAIDRETAAKARVRAARTRAASHKSVQAAEANRRSAEEFASKQARRREADQAAKVK